MLELKPRYTRDQLSMVIRQQERYRTEELARAASYCVQWELFTATDFGDTLEYFAIKREPCKNAGIKLPVKYSLLLLYLLYIFANTMLVKLDSGIHPCQELVFGGR